MPRFAVDTAVVCRTDAGWKVGTVRAINYRQEHWPAGRQAPYQVELEDGTLIFAPVDNDSLIRVSRPSQGRGRRPTEAELAELTSACFQKLPAAIKSLPETGRVSWVRRMLYTVDEDDDEGAALDAREAAGAEEVQAIYRDMVRLRYQRLVPALYEPSELARFVEPALREALLSGDNGRVRMLLSEESGGLFSLTLFTEEYCTLLLRECEHFEAWCDANRVEVKRPNTMNNYGAILDDFGMAGVMDAVMTQYVAPLSRVCGFADVMGGERLTTHHAFVVAYAMGKDLDLSFHVDSSVHRATADSNSGTAAQDARFAPRSPFLPPRSPTRAAVPLSGCPAPLATGRDPQRVPWQGVRGRLAFLSGRALPHAPEFRRFRCRQSNLLITRSAGALPAPRLRCSECALSYGALLHTPGI